MIEELIAPDHPIFNDTHTPNFTLPGYAYLMGVEWMPYPQIAEGMLSYVILH